LNLLENYEPSDPEIEIFEKKCSKKFIISLLYILEIEGPEFSKTKIFKIVCNYLCCDRIIKSAVNDEDYWMFFISTGIVMRIQSDKSESEKIAFALIQEYRFFFLKLINR
jgi:hypothetical protein